MATTMKNIKLVTLKHKCYSSSCDASDSYFNAVDSMVDCAISLVNQLKDKYKQYSFATDIKYRHDCDSDDDRFDYVYLTVPEADVSLARTRLHNATGMGSRGWYLSVDAEEDSNRVVSYTMYSKRLRPGQLRYLANQDVSSIHIGGVDHYGYDFGPNRLGNIEARKSCIINNSGVSTKMLAALSAYSFDPTKVKSKLPKDSKKQSGTNYIVAFLEEKNRANLMRLARTNPKVLKFYANFMQLDIPNEEKSDFIKAYYAAQDKKAKEAIGK